MNICKKKQVLEGGDTPFKDDTLDLYGISVYAEESKGKNKGPKNPKSQLGLHLTTTAEAGKSFTHSNNG